MVVLQIDLDEGLPVVVALVQLHVVEHHALEVERGAWPHVRQVGLHVASVVLEQQTVPLAQRVVVEVQAGVLLEVRRAEQAPGLFTVRATVGPAVQRADDVAAGAAAAGLAEVARPLSMTAWRWRHTLETSSTPLSVRTRARPPASCGSAW